MFDGYCNKNMYNVQLVIEMVTITNNVIFCNKYYLKLKFNFKRNIDLRFLSKKKHDFNIFKK